MELRGPSKIMKIAYVGEEGSNGRGGSGREGGRDGNNQIARFTKKKDFFSCSFSANCKYHTSWEHLETEQISSSGSKGSNGVSGRSVSHTFFPRNANGIRNRQKIINEYKSYLRENMNNRFQKLSIVSFLNLLDSKSGARKHYGVPYLLESSNYVRERDEILALFNEFQELEEQYTEFGHLIDFSSFYSSLLERINAYAINQKDIQIDNKKVLNYLYTATLGKIYFLRENEELLYLNVQTYLDQIEDNIKTLQDFQMINSKVNVINPFKDNYRIGIEKKIQEAQFLIEKQINPEMERINAEIDNQLNYLIQEAISSKKQSEKDYEEVARKTKALEDTLTLKGIFNCLKIIGGVADLMGPYGETFVTIINGGGSVAEHLALNNEKETINIPAEVEVSLNTLKENIETLKRNKIDHLDKLLKNVEEVERNSEALTDFESKTEDIREKLQKIRDNELDFMHLWDIETELEENIKRIKLELEKFEGDEKTIVASNTLEKIVQDLKFGSLFSEMLSKYKNNREEIDTITKSMEEMTYIPEILKLYEQNIYETISPMLQNLEYEIKNTSANLADSSHVAPDFKKWQVQSSLKDMKLQILKLTEGRGIQNDLNRCIEKLDEVVTTLINVYDRMEIYQNQQNLANYIADISSVAADNIDIEDQQLASAVNKLEYAIQVNLVLEQYKSAIDALRQWVFPFADHYIEKSMLPSQLLQTSTNIENFVQTATRQMEAIRQKILLYESSIRDGDEFLQCEEFSSRYDSSQPFYVWENEANPKSISNLLSGKEVVLKADINESAPDKEAIKFSKIEFDFRTKNESAQTSLTETLRGFDIIATHLGNSYYRYEEDLILITSDSVAISYSFEKNDDGIPIRSNEIYNRLKVGNILLSPYALWEVKLIHPTNKSAFKELDKYKNEINVELSGLGTFVLKNAVGFAENNSFTSENATTENSAMVSSIGVGLRECRRSQHRSTRSVNGVVIDGDFMTNDASKGISSPISFLHNFFNTYFVSNLVMSINQYLPEEQKEKRTDCPQQHEEHSETKNTVPPLTITDVVEPISENDGTQRIGQKSETVFGVDFHEDNSCLKSFLLSDQKYESNNYSIQVPDLNYSLLLADLVTRTLTHNKYKSSIDECLLSPQEVILRKIGDGAVRDESDVKKLLQRHLLEKEVNTPSSWLSKLKGYANSLIQALLLRGNSDTVEYVQDIRHLLP